MDVQVIRQLIIPFISFAGQSFYFKHIIVADWMEGVTSKIGDITNSQ